MEKRTPKAYSKMVMVVVATLLLVSYSVPVIAAGDYGTDARNKLARGVVNGLSGWLEFPKQIYVVSRDNDAFTGFIFGAAKGVTDSVLRTAAGVYETATFFAPVPSDYELVIGPEYVWDDIE